MEDELLTGASLLAKECGPRGLGFESSVFRHACVVKRRHSGFKLRRPRGHSGSTPDTRTTRRLVVEEQTRQAENLFYASGVRVRIRPSRLHGTGRLRAPDSGATPFGVIHLDQGGHARRHARVIPPPADLADIVESAFVLHDQAARGPTGSTSWRIVPDASMHVILVIPAALRRGEARAIVVGARSSFTDIDVSGRQLTLGVRFRPGALSAVARDHASSFTDRAFPAEDVLGCAWRSAGERVLGRDPHEALLALLDLLRATTRGRVHADRTVAALTRASSVAEAAETVAMPLRTFHARVRETIGLSPKRLMRILRLHRVLETFRASRGWAAAAASTGFADQPHLVRELHALLGETPGQWLARGAADSFKTAGSRMTSSRV